MVESTFFIWNNSPRFLKQSCLNEQTKWMNELSAVFEKAVTRKIAILKYPQLHLAKGQRIFFTILFYTFDNSFA
jgi:hypothetical protein